MTPTIPLERIIIQQHELEDRGIAEDEMKTILHSSKCLLVFDGYDEYKKGTNAAIDTVISGKRRNSFVLITSRPDYIAQKDRERLTGEIQIKGLSSKSIEECINRYFDMEDKYQSEATSKDPIPAPPVTSERSKAEATRRGPSQEPLATCEGSQPGTTSEDPQLEPPAINENPQSGATSKDPLLEPPETSEGSQPGTTSEEASQTKLKSRDLIKKAQNRGIYEFLKIPILLLMLSVLYVETGSLPERRIRHYLGDYPNLH